MGRPRDETRDLEIRDAGNGGDGSWVESTCQSKRWKRQVSTEMFIDRLPRLCWHPSVTKT